MEVITLTDFNGLSYRFEVTDYKYKHMGVDDIYAIAIFYNGRIVYNLDFDPEKYEQTIILTD
ncbi:hypothetical protein [Emergencia sp.]|uniref:hypothetical protein n=1 Tax=Emergencia sp. TaxID=1926557 RepID=UPI003AF16BED